LCPCENKFVKGPTVCSIPKPEWSSAMPIQLMPWAHPSQKKALMPPPVPPRGEVACRSANAPERQFLASARAQTAFSAAFPDPFRLALESQQTILELWRTSRLIPEETKSSSYAEDLVAGINAKRVREAAGLPSFSRIQTIPCQKPQLRLRGGRTYLRR
jgi:hypothetical protein